MTDREKAIVMARTGICMLAGKKFKIFHEYIEELMGRPVHTIEMAMLGEEIKNKADKDFIKLCERDDTEPCDDCISRQAAIDTYKNLRLPIYPLEELPPVKPEQKMGHWIKIDDCSNSGYYCSKCHKKVVKDGWSDTVKIIKYCPNCGAKMEGEE